MFDHDPQCILNRGMYYDNGYSLQLAKELKKNQHCKHHSHLGMAIYCQDPESVRQYLPNVKKQKLSPEVIGSYFKLVDLNTVHL